MKSHLISHSGQGRKIVSLLGIQEHDICVAYECWSCDGVIDAEYLRFVNSNL